VVRDLIVNNNAPVVPKAPATVVQQQQPIAIISVPTVQQNASVGSPYSLLATASTTPANKEAFAFKPKQRETTVFGY